MVFMHAIVVLCAAALNAQRFVCFCATERYIMPVRVASDSGLWLFRAPKESECNMYKAPEMDLLRLCLCGK